jgi:xanthine dehydrogenase small subunit
MPLTFFVNGRREVLQDHEVNPRMTLLEFLREKAHGLTGTKASCTQGGCGACTVLLSSRNEATGEVEHKSCNACLRPLLSMEGQQVITTEGIGSKQDGFHPVQERIANCNGTQCGFCTPGHVMAMYGLLREKAGEPCTIDEIEERFDGTICRCTGYRSILSACHTFAAEGLAGDARDSVAGEAERSFTEYDASAEPATPAAVAAPPTAFQIEGWHRAISLADIDAIQAANGGGAKQVQMVCGGTSTGVYPDMHDETDIFVDISAVKELSGVAMTESGLVVGSTTTLSQLLAALLANSAVSASYGKLATHIKKVANWQVRNVGSWAGNLVMAKTKGFSSDIATIFMGAGATVKVRGWNFDGSAVTRDLDIHSFLHESDSMGGSLILSMAVPILAEGEVFATYRSAQRPNNAHAFVNASFRAKVCASGTVSDAVLAFGVVQKKAVFATAAQEALSGASLDVAGLAAVLAALEQLEIEPETQYHSVNQPAGKDAYRRNLTSSFVFKFFLELLASAGKEVPAGLATAGSVLIDERGVSTGKRTFETVLPADHPGKNPRPKVEAKEQVRVCRVCARAPVRHRAPLSLPLYYFCQYLYAVHAEPTCLRTDQASGQTLYHNDIKLGGQVFAALVPSTRAPAKIVAIDWDAALAMPGVLEYVDATDAPGAAGSFAGVAQGGEPLFAAVGSETLFVGHPVGAVIAKSRREAEAAVKAVVVTYAEPASPGLYSIEEAVAAGSFFTIPGEINADTADKHWAPGEKIRCVPAGSDVDKSLADAAANGGTVVEGQLSIGGQSHFCMEKHTCVVAPDEQDRMVIYASTQLPDHTRALAALNLGLSIDKVQVIVKRLGGAYGGKLDKSFWTTLACTACAKKMRRPVHIQSDIRTDMMIMGTARHPCLVTYKAALDKDGQIAAFDVKTTINGGRCSGFSGFCAGEIHNCIDSVYNIGALRHETTVVLTNTATNGAVRGPGLVQAITITETIIEHLAAAAGMDAQEIRSKNICASADLTAEMHGGPIKQYNMPDIWGKLVGSSAMVARQAAVNKFNAANTWKKRGISMVPMKYNHAWLFALGANVQVSIQATDVHLGQGPSVKVHQPCIEMGQGLTTKVQQMVSTCFSMPFDKIFVAATNTDVVPNGGTGVTGGSVASEAVCEATRLACVELLQRMGHTKETPPTSEEFTAMVGASSGIFGIGDMAANLSGTPAAGGTNECLGKKNLTAVGIWNPPFKDAFNGAASAEPPSCVPVPSS